MTTFDDLRRIQYPQDSETDQEQRVTLELASNEDGNLSVNISQYVLNAEEEALQITEAEEQTLSRLARLYPTAGESPTRGLDPRRMRFLPAGLDYKRDANGKVLRDEDGYPVSIIREPILRIDDNGNVLYAPLGDFRGNRVDANIRIGINQNELERVNERNPQPGEINGAYGMQETPLTDDPEPDPDGSVIGGHPIDVLETDTGDRDVTNPVSDEGVTLVADEPEDVITIGDLNDSIFWQRQGWTGACMFASAVGALNSLLKAKSERDGTPFEPLTFEELIRLGSEGGPITNRSGEPIWNSDPASERLFADEGDPPADVPGAPTTNMAQTMEVIFEHFGFEAKNMFTSNVSELVEALAMGYKIIVNVDASELSKATGVWASNKLATAQMIIDGDGEIEGLDAIDPENVLDLSALLINEAIDDNSDVIGGDHAVWFTGVQVRDGELFVVFNNSAMGNARSPDDDAVAGHRPGAGILLPLSYFTHTWDNSGFQAVVIGEDVEEDLVDLTRDPEVRQLIWDIGFSNKVIREEKLTPDRIRFYEAELPKQEKQLEILIGDRVDRFNEKYGTNLTSDEYIFAGNVNSMHPELINLVEESESEEDRVIQINDWIDETDDSGEYRFGSDNLERDIVDFVSIDNPETDNLARKLYLRDNPDATEEEIQSYIEDVKFQQSFDESPDRVYAGIVSNWIDEDEDGDIIETVLLERVTNDNIAFNNLARKLYLRDNPDATEEEIQSYIDGLKARRDD